MRSSKGKWLVIPAIGIAYYVWLLVTHIAIPCMFHKITGWLCPGCGITNLFLSLGRLDFKGAFHANPFLFVTGPLLLAEIVYDWIRQSRNKPNPRWNKILLWVYVAALCIFGVLRNVL